ncbi:unnamed protein product, partial [Rotaria magnacalcarata]
NHLNAMGISYYKKKRAPKYTEKQLEDVPTRARRLYRLLLNGDFELVMDDEKYFLLNSESVAANRDFYTSDKNVTPPEIKFRRSQKYEPKILVWVALLETGLSEPFFAKQQQAAASDIIKKEKLLFWPDLASSHYGHKVTQYLDENHVQYVERQSNPPNCPQSRSIETLWSILADMMYEGGWEAKTIYQLKRRIAKKLKEIDIEVFQATFSSVRKQLRKIADKGPYASCSS